MAIIKLLQSSLSLSDFLEYPEKINCPAHSLDDLRYLITTSVKNEKEFTLINELLEEYKYEQRE